MKNLENEIREEAELTTQKLLKQAKINEPKITEDLRKITFEVSAEIVGLENKFKSKKSLTEKVVYQAIKYFQYRLNREFSETKIIETTVSGLIKQQNDVLRYTFILPFEKYTFGFRQTLEKLKGTKLQNP